MTAIAKSAKTLPAAKNVVAGKNLPYVLSWSKYQNTGNIKTS